MELTQWEYTIAEMLSDAGYETAMFGKWHLGDSKGRYPTDQGFDEWYGIPNSTDEAFWANSELFREGVHPQVKLEHVMEGRRGTDPKELGVYDLEKRRVIDGEFTAKAVDYIRRKAKGEKPFFLFIPYTQTHLPVEPSPAFHGKTGNGRWADVLAQTDHYIGRLLDVIDEMGIRENTIFIFTADNGAEAMVPHQGFSGPWRGSYFTGLEGSLRVSFSGPLAGQRFPSVRSRTRSFTRWICCPRLRVLPALRSPGIGSSTASIRVASCLAGSRNRTVSPSSSTSATTSSV